MLKFINIFIALSLFSLLSAWLYLTLRDNSSLALQDAGHLENTVLASTSAWKSSPKALATSGEVARATEKGLNVSEYLYREYKNNDGKSFDIYISYWGEGVEPIRIAGAHTPDRCWIENGWKKDKFISHFSFDSFPDIKNIMPAEYREMTFLSGSNSIKNNTRRYIFFWHIVDGKYYDSSQQGDFVGRLKSYLDSSLFEFLNGIPEQYFVRIDSDYDLRELLNDEGFRQILNSLGKLALNKN